jgi:hypothetical protein
VSTIRSIYICETKYYEQCGVEWLETARSEVGGGVPPWASLLPYWVLWDQVSVCEMVLQTDQNRCQTPFVE